MRCFLLMAYAVAGVCEVGGIGLIIGDWRSDRRRLRLLLEEPMRVHGGTRFSAPSHEGAEIRAGGERAIRSLNSRLSSIERQFTALLANYERSDEHLQNVMKDQYERPFRERARAPLLLLAGVVIGAAANIAALYS